MTALLAESNTKRRPPDQGRNTMNASMLVAEVERLMTHGLQVSIAVDYLADKHFSPVSLGQVRAQLLVDHPRKRG